MGDAWIRPRFGWEMGYFSRGTEYSVYIFNYCVLISDYYVSTVLEKGLQEALVATSALYDNSIETLSTLSVNDILKIFNGATVVELMLEPGLTVLKMAMNAKCFLTESNILNL